jgi:DedD protein
MAKAISDEELQLKKRARRRLVGAIALVLLIVVFLPMILDSEPKPLNQDVSITIPPIPKPESAPELSVPATQPPSSSSSAPGTMPHIAGLPQGPAQSAGTETQSETPATDGAATESPKPAAKSAVTRPAVPKPALEAKPAPKAAPKHEAKPVAVAAAPVGDDSFVVQLGAFSNAVNARALQRKLQDNKFKAYTELIKESTGDRTRVRVGPFASREAAEKARDRMKSLKLVGDATVVRRD